MQRDPIIYGPMPIRMGRLLASLGAFFSAAMLFPRALEGSREALLYAALLPLIGVWLARSGLRSSGRFHLTIDPEAKQLGVERYVLGRCVASHVVSLEDVRDVRVESKRIIEDVLDDRDPSPPFFGRILLIGGDGKVTPLTPYLRGERVHLQAAVALRAALAISTKSGPVEAELARASELRTHPMRGNTEIAVRARRSSCASPVSPTSTARSTRRATPTIGLRSSPRRGART